MQKTIKIITTTKAEQMFLAGEPVTMLCQVIRDGKWNCEVTRTLYPNRVAIVFGQRVFHQAVWNMKHKLHESGLRLIDYRFTLTEETQVAA